uniref:Uncharacterized protein n=1 Tax=Tanacetum cinerariifolium TaxID=118510 RepID=A0A6L2K3E8_TANCI|nr:hypothetical protein [Tanacetum cinerariifolium]
MESFKDMLHICHRIPGQSFDELPFEEEILDFIRDDFLFSMIKVVSRHQNTQQYGAMLPIELTNDKIRNTKAYKEYYDFATGEAALKPKASARRKRSGSETSISPLTVAVTPKLTATTKGKQPAKAIKAKSPSVPSEVARTEAQQLKIVLKRSRQQTHISQPGGSGTDEGTSSKPGVPDVPTDESKEELSWNSSDDVGADDQEKVDDDDERDEGNDREEGEEDDDEEDKDADERDDDDKDQEGMGLQASLEIEDSYMTLTPVKPNGQQVSSSVSSQFVTSMLNPTLDRMYEAVQVFVQLQSDRLCEEAQKENDEFLKTVDENIKKIIKEQVKEQVKAQVFKILPRIKQAVNEQLEAEVLTRSSYSSRTSYAVAVDLSEMGLKKIFIEKMEGSKSIQRSDAQRNLYKALVDAYESDKIILDTYGETVTLKRRHDDDEDKDEEPFVGPDRGSKRRREGKEPESASTPLETATKSTGSILNGSQMEEPSHLEFKTDRDWNKTLPAIYGSIQPWISELAKQADTRSSFNELLDTPLDFSNFLMNRLRVDTLTPELLAGPTYELMKGSCKSLIELEYHLEEVYKSITNQLDWVNLEGQQYPHNLMQPLPLIPDNRGRKCQQFYGFAVNRESARDVYSKRKIVVVTELKIVERHSYKHLDWITEGYEELGKVRWRKAVRGRLQDATKDHMIYRMLLLSYKRTMDTTIDQQVAMDEALVPHACRLRIERSNFRLLSDISSKESTLQLVYDVLHLTPFFKAFLVTVDYLEIYMQEFWVTATVHHHSIRFIMDNKKHILNLSFAAIINKCLTEKSSGCDSLRLSQAQILWGLYQKRNVDFAYLMWEDFIYQVEHKDTNKSNEMYYPRFTKVIIHHFMSKDPSILRRNKVNWHYVRDDHMFTKIKLVSRHQNTQQFDALLPIELTNKDIRNFNAYKEYYAVATGATPPKPKASVRKTISSFDTTVTPPTAVAGPRLSTSTKGKQPATTSKAKSLSALSEEEISWNSTDEEGDDNDDDERSDGDDGEEGDDDDEDDQEEGSVDEQPSDKEEVIHPILSTHAEEETRDDESFDPILKTPKNTDDEGNGEENLGINVDREEGHDEEEDELYRDVNINLERPIQMTQEFEDSHVTLTSVNPDGQQQSSSVSSQFVTSMFNLTPDVGLEFIFEMTSQMDVQTPTSVAHLHVSAPTITPSTISTITTTQQAPTPPTTALSTLLQDLPNFSSLFGFDHRLKTLEANFSELHDEAQNENDEFLKTIDENMQKIIKDQVKEQVKVQISKILPKIEQTVNEQLEAEVLTRSSNSSKTSYVVAADLSEMELKKILIEKMEETQSRRRDVAMMMLIKTKNPPLDQTGGPRDVEKERSQSQQALHKRKLPGALASQHKGLNLDKRRQASADDQLIVEPSQHPEWFSQKKKPPTPDRVMKKLMELEFFLEEVYKATTDQLDWVNPKGQQYPLNLLKPLPLIPNNQGRHVIPFDHFINNDLEYLRGGASSRTYTTSVTKTKAADYGLIKWIEDLVPRTIWIQEPIGYDKHRRIIDVTELKIVKYHDYKHLDWITVRRDDGKLYKFKEGDFKRLRIQDIKDMLLLLVQGKLTNLTVEERFAFNVSLRMFTRSIVIQRRVEDLQLGNKDKQNMLMRIDELHKFSDGTLTDVRTALDDRLNGIRMKYLP